MAQFQIQRRPCARDAQGEPASDQR